MEIDQRCSYNSLYFFVDFCLQPHGNMFQIFQFSYNAALSIEYLGLDFTNLRSKDFDILLLLFSSKD